MGIESSETFLARAIDISITFPGIRLKKLRKTIKNFEVCFQITKNIEFESICIDNFLDWQLM